MKEIHKQNMSKYIASGLIIFAASVLFMAFCFYLVRGYSFANPGFLYLIIPLILFGLGGGLVKGLLRPTIKYPLAKGIELPFSLSTKIVNWLPFALCMMAMFLCILALARPREEGATKIPPAKGIDIMMTIDISRSMDALDFKPNRLGAAKTNAADFVAKRTSDRIGVVVFDDLAMLQCPLTLDYFAVFDYIKMIKIGMMGGLGGTAIGDAIAVSVQHLKDSVAKSKVIILLTDGESNSDTVDPIAAARAAETYGIKIYTIAMSDDGLVQRQVETFFGTKKNVAMPSISSEGQALLMEIAKITGGEFFRAKNNLELQTVYSKIDALEKTEFKETIQINYKDKYINLLTWALGLLLAAFILDKFIFVKIP